MGYVVALTGGICSGKSNIASVFARLGINVIDADIIARQLVEPGTPLLQAIVNRYGTEILQPSGSLNRRLLREKVFTNVSSELPWLNSRFHPLIQAETGRQITQATSPYVLWVVPLLVENNLSRQANRVLVVDISRNAQLQRIMQRDNVTKEHAEQIIAAQATRNARLAVANDVINNNGTANIIASHVVYLHIRYLKLAKQGD